MGAFEYTAVDPGGKPGGAPHFRQPRHDVALSHRKHADGHAAGLAAATAVARDVPVRSLDGEELRALLNADGARLDG